MVERMNRELKRRTKVVGVFPNEESLFRLVGSILMDVNEEWVTGKKYLQMHEEWSEAIQGTGQITENMRRYQA